MSLHMAPIVYLCTILIHVIAVVGGGPQGEVSVDQEILYSVNKTNYAILSSLLHIIIAHIYDRFIQHF